MFSLTVLVITPLILDVISAQAAVTLDVSGVPQFLSDYNTNVGQFVYESFVAKWNYNTNMTAETQQISGEKSQAESVYKAEQAEIASQVPLDQITDPTNRRLMEKIAVKGYGALTNEDLSNLTKVKARMQTGYSTAKVCYLPGCLPLDLDLITAIMANEKNYNVLRYDWVKRRDMSGKKMRKDYKQYIELENKAAMLNGFNDNGEYWRDAYESSDFEQLVEDQWQTIQPLYEQLHAYVRRKLYNRYGGNVINLKGPIPDHLLGNINDIVEPFSGKERPDATLGLQKQGYNATTMFRTADKFFSDLGLEPLPQEFWDESMIVKPEDGREVDCHPSAWDFRNAKDFRSYCLVSTPTSHFQYFN